MLEVNNKGTKQGHCYFTIFKQVFLLWNLDGRENWSGLFQNVENNVKVPKGAKFKVHLKGMRTCLYSLHWTNFMYCASVFTTNLEHIICQNGSNCFFNRDTKYSAFCSPTRRHPMNSWLFECWSMHLWPGFRRICLLFHL